MEENDSASVSARLSDRIAVEIDEAGGWIPFSRFMELALYAPGLGYYSAGAVKVGRDSRDGSDFTTAPESTPLFARALAAPIAELLDGSDGTIIELGGGSGRLAADLLLALEERRILPDLYAILEPSPDLRDRQRAIVERDVPHLRSRVVFLDRLPDRIGGPVLGNEVLDALPVSIVVREVDRWRERGVIRRCEGFGWRSEALTPEAAAALESTVLASGQWPDGYCTELHPRSNALVSTLTERMDETAAMLFVDYGFPESEYFHLQRFGGSLMAHRRHRSSLDLLAEPGLQDLTAHVNFSAVARAATAAGGLVAGYTSQASFLVSCGILDQMSGSATDVARWAPQAAALNRLLSEAEMGELFKVIAVTRRPRDLVGFERDDRRGAL